MEIGKKLKRARAKAGLTQEQVAAEIHVTRQTISNWENEKSYPDIVSVILLSDLYQVTLDELLKGDQEMIKHLKESTDVVESNRKLLLAVGFHLALYVPFVFVLNFFSDSKVAVFAVTALVTLSVFVLVQQLIKRL